MELKIQEWKNVRIGKYFNTYTGGDLIISNVQEGDIPVISHTSDNNGIKIYSEVIEGRKLFNCKKTISLADRGTFFAAVQTADFYIGTRVKALEFKDGEHSENVLKFIVTVINNEQFRFSYGRNCTNGLDDLCIKLPILDDDSLDYDFMEKYISSLDVKKAQIPDYFLEEGFNKACWYLDNIDQNKFENEYAGRHSVTRMKLNDRKWKKFVLRDILDDVHNGKSYNVSELVVAADGDEYVAYITRTDEKNGVSMCVQDIEYDGLEQAEAITIGDTTATIFYQNHKFITGPHMIVIRADWFNKYTANFIITLLNKEKYRYPVFGRAFSKELIKETKLYLPVDDAGNPDYQFMEDYIKGCQFSCKLE